MKGSFAALGLHHRLAAILAQSAITAPTSIQTAVLPTLIRTSHHHFLAAQTGTGKTLAYLLPILHKWISADTKPKSLVLTCNRELILQSEYVLEPFRGALGLATGALFSGQKTEEWKHVLAAKPDIVYGTMDRVNSLRDKGELSFAGLHELVVDECDTLADSGKSQDIEKVISAAQKVPDLRLTLVSATMPRNVEAILDNYFAAVQGSKRPFLQRAIEEKAHYNLEHLHHEFVQIDALKPGVVLLKVLQETAKQDKGLIIFCNSIASAKVTLALVEKNGYRAVGMHGDNSLKERVRNYKSFRSLEKNILVCTDLGSRGMDFPLVSHVIQCDFPKTISDYLHRAGRAGRCYRDGTVVTLYRKEDVRTLEHIKNSFLTGVPLKITSSAFSLENKLEVLHKKLSDAEKAHRVIQKFKPK